LAGLYLTKQINQPEKAIEHLKALAAVELKDNNYAKRIARIYRDENEFEQAEQYALTAVYTDPYDLSAHKLLASVYEKGGNETGAALAFTVEPFLWKTWWFQLAVLTGFTCMVFVIARYVSFRRLRSRLQMVERQAVLDKERTRIARDIHDDLGCRLTKILLLTELSLRNAREADNTTERVKQISATAREGMQSLDATVWAINPRNDTLPYLIDYLAQFAVEFLQAADIRCHLDLPDHPPARAVSAEVRHNLFLAAKEALNNIVRHSGARAVHLRVATDENELGIVVEDDGRGFGQAPDNASADGLRNMRQRLEEIRGRCRIESTPGKGTKISFIHSWRDGK